jgi:hypothetical protein
MQQIVPTNNNNSGDNNVETNDLNPFGPIMKDGVYNEKAHHYHVERQVERDLTIPKIVDELGKKVCNFIEVESLLGGTQINLIYHPNPTAHDLQWITLPALAKGNGGRYYKEISNKRVFWFYKVLSSDIISLISNTFEEDLINATYNSDLPTFAKKAAKFILSFPHKDFGTYGCYLIAFVNMIKLTGSNLSNVIIHRIAVAIAVQLKNKVDFDDRNLPDIEIYKKVRDISTKYTIQECSKSVHYKISLIDINAQKASLTLDELDRAAAEEEEKEKLAKQAKLDMLKAAVKNGMQNQPKALPTSSTPSPVETRKRKIEEVYENSNDDDVSGEESSKSRKLN